MANSIHEKTEAPAATTASAQAAASTAPVNDGRKTPEDWASEFNQRRRFVPKMALEATETGSSFDPSRFLWKHNAAAMAHGWGAHAHHEQTSIRLTREQYAAALKAVESTNEKGEYEPHGPATSKHLPKPVADGSAGERARFEV